MRHMLQHGICAVGQYLITPAVKPWCVADHHIGVAVHVTQEALHKRYIDVSTIIKVLQEDIHTLHTLELDIVVVNLRCIEALSTDTSGAISYVVSPETFRGWFETVSQRDRR